MPHIQEERFWRITGYKSTTKIFDHTLRLGLMTERGMEELLRALVARTGLSFEEMVDSYAKRGTRRHRPLLNVRSGTGSIFLLECGLNPYFTATVVGTDGRPIRHNRHV